MTVSITRIYSLLAAATLLPLCSLIAYAYNGAELASAPTTIACHYVMGALVPVLWALIGVYVADQTAVL